MIRTLATSFGYRVDIFFFLEFHDHALWRYDDDTTLAGDFS